MNKLLNMYYYKMITCVMPSSKSSLIVDTFGNNKLIFNYSNPNITTKDVMDVIKDKIKYHLMDVKDFSLCSNDGMIYDDTKAINNIEQLKMVETKNIPQIMTRTSTLIKINVSMLNGSIIETHIHFDATVLELKYWFGVKNNISFDQIRFIFNGKQLENDKTLESYGIKNDTKITLVLRFKGGMYQEVSGRNGAYKLLDPITIYDLDEEEFIIE